MQDWWSAVLLDTFFYWIKNNLQEGSLKHAGKLMIQKVIIYLEHLGEVKAHAYAKPGVKNLNIKKALLKRNYCQVLVLFFGTGFNNGIRLMA